MARRRCGFAWDEGRRVAEVLRSLVEPVGRRAPLVPLRRQLEGKPPVP